jgi:Histidine phosphatase superfamily (branch 1)
MAGRRVRSDSQGETTLRNLRAVALPYKGVLILRHAARVGPRRAAIHTAEDSWPLTRQGRVDARRFGTKMPSFSNLQLTHTRLERTRDTARLIAAGFRARHPEARVTIKGADPGLSLWTRYAKDVDLLREWRERSGTRFVSDWLRGEIPPTVLAPAVEAVTDLVARLRSALHPAPDSTLVLAVSHDVHLQAIREILLPGRVRPSTPVNFLDGILLTWDPAGRTTIRWRDELNPPVRMATD